ncbi:Acetylornithine deacetylase [Paenibacillus sp. CECT 9249]|uniref:M20 family metallopeptidase n=1 Tax=Paenibacillus sp. CECT 9249 TaxID=2845385 RepID=UPI001E50B929|nr:M20 family metallopeptidase [Paenibacillus sp. CECT 9249]CAH0118928.1 Acetylornithine deacetylase [Paenibacillus sp. CECT 9249]
MHTNPIQLIRPQETIDLLERLIRIPGHEDCPGQEKAIGEFLYRLFREEGIDVELQEVSDGRSNVIARLQGTGGGKSLMLNGHIDTIPPYDMPDALRPAVRNGKLYGRGAVDMLGAIAAMASALIAVRRSQIRLRGDLIFTGVIGEESGSAGAWHMVNQGVGADYAVVGEPTMMDIAVAHKGVEWFEIQFEGLAAHGSNPDAGINAIYHANRFIQKVRETYIPELARRAHPLLGHSTVNIGEIHGGKRPTIVPDCCVVRLERRYIPGENREQVFQEMLSLLEEVKQAEDHVKVSIRRMPITKDVPHDALESNPDSPLVQALSDACREETGRNHAAIGVHFWTDAAILSNYGQMESVVCGPGNVAQAHSNDEYIELSQLEAATRVYIKTALQICGN